jgi:CheY-like chemotaxis protein
MSNMAPDKGIPHHPLVLVVEEDEAIRAMLDIALSGYGFSVLTAADGKIGLETFRRHLDRNPLVLMDVNMPGMSGAETLSCMQLECPAVRCYFMSGDSGLADWPALIAQGALGVFAKPFSSLESLAETLNRCLAGGAE